jgi:hypothetical protein
MNCARLLFALFGVVFGMCCSLQNCWAESDDPVHEIPIIFSNADIDELNKMYDDSRATYVYLGQEERLAILTLSDVLERNGLKGCVERILQGYVTVPQRVLAEVAECVAGVDGAEIITGACKTIIWCPLAFTQENERVILRMGVSYRTLKEFTFERSNFDDGSFSTCLLIPQEMFGEGGRLLDMPEIFVGVYMISGANWNMTPSSISLNSISPLNPALPITIEGGLKVTGATEFKDDVTITHCNTLYVDKIDPTSETYTEFSGDVRILDCSGISKLNVGGISNGKWGCLSVGGKSDCSPGFLNVGGWGNFSPGFLKVGGGGCWSLGMVFVHGPIFCWECICPSDDRIKVNETPLNKATSLDQVMLLSPVQYNFIGNEPTDLEYGFIADEVQLVMPEAVDTQETFTFGEAEYTDFLSVKENVVLTKLVAAFQELAGRVETLENMF